MDQTVKKQARQLAGGTFGMRDSRPAYMAFRHDGSGVTGTIWVWECEGKPEAPEFHGYVDLDTGWVCDLEVIDADK